MAISNRPGVGCCTGGPRYHLRASSSQGVGNAQFRWFVEACIDGALAVLGCLAGAPAAKALYDVEPGEIPGKPGTIIRVWPLEGGGPSVDRDRQRLSFPVPLHRPQWPADPGVRRHFRAFGPHASRRTQHHRLGPSYLGRGAALRALADAGHRRVDLGPRPNAKGRIISSSPPTIPVSVPTAFTPI